LLSGGIDSPVAGYLAMKRGVQIEAIHFHSPPFTSERAKQKVLDLAEELTAFGNTVNIHMIPFTKLQQQRFRDIPEVCEMAVMRRMLLLKSEKFSQQNSIVAIGTGEYFVQVASHTMESMHTINEVPHYTIIRPLITMDKADIVQLSKKINTYD